MKTTALTLSFTLLVAAFLGPVQAQIQGLRLNDVRIGMNKDVVLSGRRASDGKVRTSIQIVFDDQAMAGFGNAGRISFQVESGKQIHVGFILPDDPTSGSPSAYLSVFRNAR